MTKFMKTARHFLFGYFFVFVLLGSQHASGASGNENYGRALASTKVPGVGACQAVAVVENRLYATGRGMFHVLDISEPTKPKPLGVLSGLGNNTRQIFVKGSTAFITARQDGLWLIDISDSSQPKIISHYDTVEMATGICVSGSLAFVATRQYGVEIIDVSNQRVPRHLSMLKTGEAQSCWVRNGFLYIGDWAPKKLVVADVRNPLKPVIVGEGLLDGYGDGGCLRGDICFAATGHHSREQPKEAGYGKGHGLEIYNVSDPRKPALISGVKFPASYHLTNDMWTARVSGDHCVVADTWNGLFVVNISDLKSPKIMAHSILPPRPKTDVPDPVGGIALGDGIIYAGGIFTGLYVVSAPGLVKPVVAEPDQAPPIPSVNRDVSDDSDFLTYKPEGQVRSVTVVDDIAWTACGAAGIQAIRLGKTLKQESVTPGKGDVFHVAVSGNRLYAAENTRGLAIYEIGPSLKLTELGRLEMKGHSVKQVTCPSPGRFALFHCGTATAWIADVSDPAHPVVVLRDSQQGLFYGDQLVPELVDDRYLVAFWHRSGPAWYDVSGEKPVHRGNSPDERLYSFTDGACLFGEQLLITKRGKLQLLEPGEMREVSQLPTIGIKGQYLKGRPATDGTWLALSRRHEQRVKVLDLSDLQNPKLSREYHLKGHPGACSFWKGRLVIPASYQGLLVERK